uniref:NADH-ubiquinone oxidoreductase chain 1 n=1 Tax=Eleutherocaulis alte TaxID=74076 RepID=A0A1P7YWB6_9EUPU|nr:NADH dehydrogenase subunit 1 [Eleutherocaulis alte]
MMLAVAYFSLIERNFLGMIQIRVGPQKMGPIGIFQPLLDAAKLIFKETVIPEGSFKFGFYLSAGLSLLISLSLWLIYPSSMPIKFISYGLLFFFCVSSINVYCVLGAGWSSNSVYAFLGAVRAAAQSISYEVSMFFILLFPSYQLCTYSWGYSSNNFPILFLCFWLFMIWFVTILAETNRAPFDFAEGESELVSGFNVEYSSVVFTLLFLSEYMNILFISMATSVWFLYSKSCWFFVFLIFLVSSVFLVVRGSFPRLRFDKLMLVCWKTFLPFSICMMMLVIF